MESERLARRVALVGAVIAACAGVGGVILGAADIEPAVAAVVAIVIAGAVAFGVLYLFVEPAQRSIVLVANAAQRISRGAFGERVTHTSNLTDPLAASFNHMVDRLSDLVQRSDWDRARIEAAFRATTDALVAVGPDTAIQQLNPAAEALFHMSNRDAHGRPLIEAAHDYEIDQLVRRVIERGEPAESPLIAFGASRVPLRAVAVPIQHDVDWAVLLVLADLTTVQRLNAVRRDFLSNVSHEIRTPLASIRALVDVIEDDVDDAEQRNIFVAHLRNHIERLTRLVNELLDLSRIESGAVDLRPEELDVRSLLDEAIDAMDQQISSRRVGIDIDAPEGILLEADRSSVVRVFVNLLDNAIKFSPEGGTVRVRASEDGDLVTIRFEDDGPGINPENLSRVFERFYKGDSSRQSPGTGLGLAIVKHLARAHGGTATVESEPGKGAAFTVRFPRVFIGPHRQAA
jgi:two-component system phosphate regulon sensor histidine kinase PhoR